MDRAVGELGDLGDFASPCGGEGLALRRLPVALVHHLQRRMTVRLKAWRERKADAHGNVPDTPEPTLEDCAADTERKRLFEIIEELVKWENSTNEEVLERARAEIRRSCGGVLPPVYDPFSGGGSIPLEAQRLGLPAFGSDLNPVAVMIGKAMIEIPPKFKDTPPIHPGVKERSVLPKRRRAGRGCKVLWRVDAR